MHVGILSSPALTQRSRHQTPHPQPFSPRSGEKAARRLVREKPLALRPGRGVWGEG